MTIQLLIKPGHRLYKCDLNTGLITEVDRGGDTHHLYIEEYLPGVLYASALNAHNAKRKFDKMIDHIINLKNNEDIGN